MTPLAAYLLLFLAVGVGFIFVHLVAGKLVRPSKTNPEKETIYECGEPTIGSAWVQFDLRFYVVALLFVIFDVEVAFFFPWAEIFGKANAIRSSDLPEKEAKSRREKNAAPPTMEEYAEFAALVNDLASPRGSTSAINVVRERDMWRKRETMTRAEFAAYKQLKGELTDALRLIGDKMHEDIRELTPDQFAALKTQAGKLDELFKKIAADQQTQAKELVAAINKLSEADKKELNNVIRGPGQGKGGGPTAVSGSGSLAIIVGAIPGRAAQVDASLRTRSLNELLSVKPAELVVFSDESMRVNQAFAKLLPERIKAVRDLSVSQSKQVAAAAGAARAALLAAGPDNEGLWNLLSWKWMSQLGTLSPESAESLRTLSPDGLRALESSVAGGIKERADSLAWLALVEILVFFGVLLVGFAYLWKRGDLAWVRSTAAETPGNV